MKKIYLFIALLSAGCADESIYPAYTSDSLMMHANVAITKDFSANDISDLTITNIVESPPSFTGKREVCFTVSSGLTKKTYDCVRSDYAVRRFGEQIMNPVSLGNMECKIQNKQG